MFRGFLYAFLIKQKEKSQQSSLVSSHCAEKKIRQEKFTACPNLRGITFPGVGIVGGGAERDIQL